MVQQLSVADREEQPRLEYRLDGSAQDRVDDAVRLCLSSAGPLKRRVDRAIKVLAPILYEKFGPRTTELLERLQLSERDGVIYVSSFGPIYGNVSIARLKRWSLDLYQLHAWSCFLMGRAPELEFWFEDSPSSAPRVKNKKRSDGNFSIQEVGQSEDD